MDSSNAVKTATPITQLKSAIIGKAWRNEDESAIVKASVTLTEDMVFTANESYLINGLSFRTDRNTTIPVELKAGDKLFFYKNKKRAGMADPDFSVSVLLPVEQAEAFIANSKAGSEAWKKTNQPVVV